MSETTRTMTLVLNGQPIQLFAYPNDTLRALLVAAFPHAGMREETLDGTRWHFRLPNGIEISHETQVRDYPDDLLFVSLGVAMSGPDDESIERAFERGKAEGRAEGEAIERAYRAELWLGHGHGYLYGDDGEMQCHQCPADFKRDPLDSLGPKVLVARHERAQKVAEREAERDSLRERLKQSEAARHLLQVERTELGIALDYIVSCQDDKKKNPGDELLDTRNDRDRLAGEVETLTGALAEAKRREEALRSWAALRRVISYLRRVCPSKRSCEFYEEEGNGQCWWSGELDGGECPVCEERHDTTEAIRLVRRQLYVANRRLERAALAPKEGQRAQGEGSEPKA